MSASRGERRRRRRRHALLPWLLTFTSLLLVAPFVSARPWEKRDGEINGFYNLSDNGGSWLTANTGGSGGEPINVVISSTSDALLLTPGGFLDFMVSISMAGECLGQHDGVIQTANLGDGNGYVNSKTLRYDYGDPTLGTCQETVLGGNHLRYWQQNGSLADSKAWFLAVSYEKNLTYEHDIVTPDGYALGRNLLTGNATVPGGTRSPLTNRTYTTTSTSMTGFLPANSSANINHGIEYDGVTDVWVVKLANGGNVSSTASHSTSSSSASSTTSTAATMSSSTFATSFMILALTLLASSG